MRTVTGLTQAELLDGAATNERAGFRLHRFEVYNWGTFDRHVWHLGLGGDNGLLTGDIGSGKSTLVDGLVALLVPPQKLAFNKAAGAEARERTLRSYVRGQYKSERSDGAHAARPVYLRDGKHYSVLLAHFFNEGFGQHVTLAQVLWMKEPEEPPARLYVVADQPLTIQEHFGGFGSDVAALRKRLKLLAREVHDSFPPYAAAFRRRFGIAHEQALELFHQTVSMKAVGNLTDFVREHMLRPFPVQERLEGLMAHFDDLRRAHDAVLRAKRQLGLLAPLVEACDTYEQAVEEVASLRAAREALRAWFAGQKAGLLEAQLTAREAELARVAQELERLEEERRSLGLERDALRQAILESGGAQLERVKEDLARLGREQVQRRQRAEQYAELARAQGLPEASDGERFLENARGLPGLLAEAAAASAQAQNALTESGVQLHRLREEHTKLAGELESLRRRPSNLPSDMLALRERLCDGLGLAHDELPFAGELLQVRPEERDWEGAIERVLRGFGLSLLVPEAHYARVARWVETEHLGGRLVYFRVHEEGRARRATPGPASLVRKLALKPDSGLDRWLEAELARRFDYACCDTLEQFRREPHALTRQGQVKGGERHEKDDRYRLGDRSRYVLGWTNEAKREALGAQLRAIELRMQEVGERHGALQAEQRRQDTRRAGLAQLQVFRDYSELDWRSLAVEVERLTAQRRELEASSDVLRTLEAQLGGVAERLSRAEKREADRREARARLTQQQEDGRRALDECRNTFASAPEAARAQYPRVEALHAELSQGRALTAHECDARERQVRDVLQGRVDAEDKRLGRVRDALVRDMAAFKREFPEETQEADASVLAASEYRRLLAKLREDDLPRFEARFKGLLNENTIREVANFQGQLNLERHDIQERIRTINTSLRQIDYNPGRYIQLEAVPSPDADVRDFQRDLRACTEGTLTGSDEDAYSEQKFLEVKRIIERFRGREGSQELDARWTRRVTDVRNWFSFSAAERWRADDKEHEHYTDSGGKSGGQKEKLAYTVLAASLAYQFGLEWGETRSRSFRFVVIDEAFGRGSDESAQYGLELFRKLALQLLIVTPLQKVRVIEPYVASVGFVANPEGKESKLRNLTLEEYRAEREARRA